MPSATHNCRHGTGEGQCNTGGWPRNPAESPARAPARICLAACLALLVLLATIGRADTNSSAPSVLEQAAQLARAKHEQARARCAAAPQNAEAALELGRRGFELAEFATRKSDRAALAQEGIEACRRALARQSNSGLAYYYLAMNLGQLARTKGWGALRLVGQIESNFKMAAALDPKIDFAGPDRNLGYLYRDTPSFGSVGDSHKARQHLLKAVELAPDYPENRLALVEGLLQWRERVKAREELKRLEDSLPAARTRLGEPFYAPNWADWDARLKEVKAKLR